MPAPQVRSSILNVLLPYVLLSYQVYETTATAAIAEGRRFLYRRQGVQHNWSLLCTAVTHLGGVPMLLTLEDLLSRSGYRLEECRC